MKSLRQITLEEQREILAMFVCKYMGDPLPINKGWYDWVVGFGSFKLIFDLFDEGN